MGKRTNSNGNYQNVCDTFNVIVAPKNDEQKSMMKTISENVITFVKGCPGTGKTFMSVTYALQDLIRKKVDKIILTRPVVEAAGEKLGFLPGDMYEKMNPYMIPIYDALLNLVKEEEVLKKLTSKNGQPAPIRIVPLAFMRGLTFTDTFVICDEMQNSTPDQVRMLLTRIGENTKMVVCGDIEQSDIQSKNGLEDAFELLKGIEGIGFVTLSEDAVVRHPIVKHIDKRYSDREKSRRKTHGY